MNPNDENLTRPQLVQLAQQGNEEALAQLLNQALAHKQIKTVVKLTENQLKITLLSPQIPEPWSSKILIDRELLKLHWSNTPTIQIQGYQTGADNPAWTEEFLLGTQAQATKTNSATRQIIPVAESQNQRKKHQIRSIPATFKLLRNRRGAENTEKRIQRNNSDANRFDIKWSTKPIEKAGWQALAIGLLLAIILQTFWPLKLLFNGFEVIVHEIGHAVTHWLLFRYEKVWLGGISSLLSSD